MLIIESSHAYVKEQYSHKSINDKTKKNNNYHNKKKRIYNMLHIIIKNMCRWSPQHCRKIIIQTTSKIIPNMRNDIINPKLKCQAKTKYLIIYPHILPIFKLISTFIQSQHIINLMHMNIILVQTIKKMVENYITSWKTIEFILVSS